MISLTAPSKRKEGLETLVFQALFSDVSKTRFYQPLTKIKIRDPSNFHSFLHINGGNNRFVANYGSILTHQPQEE